MYFLIGLGIIVAIVYGNMLYDHIKGKKAENTENTGEKQQTSDAAPSKMTQKQVHSDAEQPSVSDDVHVTTVNNRLTGPTLTEMIADDLRQKKNIFGLPLTLCEEEDDGRLIAMDREDNIYVIETVQRPEYEEFYLQVLDDMAAQRKRIQKHAAERKVYAIVCVTTLPETLKLAAEKENSIRIFSYELNFRNIM